MRALLLVLCLVPFLGGCAAEESAPEAVDKATRENPQEAKADIMSMPEGRPEPK